MENLLKESLTLHPLYKENHFPKAYLSLKRISLRYPNFDENFLNEIWMRIDPTTYPKTETPICVNVKVPSLYAEREQRMLASSLFPSVYGIVLKKIESLGAKTFIKPYLRIAIEDPEYLGHRFNVLVGFIELWPEVETNETLRYLWIDRLTEFLMFSFNAPTSDYSVRKFESSGDLAFKEVLEAALARPGFFGQHLVTLATIKRFEKELLKSEIQSLYAKVLAMTTLEYADVEDFVTINTPSGSEPLPDLEKMVQNYLKQGPEDPHLLGFADAMMTLWDVADDTEKRFITANFSRFMRR